LRAVLSAADVLACGAMIFGAVLWLKRPISVRPLMLGVRAVVAIWLVGAGLTLWVQGLSGLVYLPQNAVWMAFPVVAVFLLREYGRTHPALAPLGVADNL
jgi:hypothetical protein